MLKTLGGISPAYLSYVNAALDTANGMAQQKTPDFDIRRDLINNLGDDVVIYGKAPSGTDLKALNDPPAIYLISSADADAAARALKKCLWPNGFL